MSNLIGKKIKIISDNENYDKYRNKQWTINHVAHNVKEHPGYDESIYPQALVDCDGLPFSLYEYEFQIIK